MFSVCKLNSPGGVFGPFIRREKGSARGEGQDSPEEGNCQEAAIAGVPQGR